MSAFTFLVAPTDDANNDETLSSDATTAVAPLPITGLSLMDTTDQTVVTTLSGNDQIRLEDSKNGSYTIRTDLATGTNLESVRTELTGAKTVDATDNGPPYSLHGENGTSLNGQGLPAGSYNLRVTAYSGDDRSGTLLQTLQASFSVSGTNSQATGLPTISGTIRVGETLTANTDSVADTDGLDNATHSYQWLADDAAVSGATGRQHTITRDQEGVAIKVAVSFSDDAGTDEALTSVATVAVVAAPNRDATGALTISATPQVDQILAADTSAITDQDGLTSVSYKYQWIRESDAITGATSSTYRLTADDLGKHIKVRVSFTDDRDNSETLTSAATDTVAAKPAPLTASFSGVPASLSGTWFKFTLTFSEEVELSYKTLRDDAFTEDGANVTKAKRTQKGSNLGWTVRVRPDGNGDVSITLPATTDCDATGAVCTADGRMLSNRNEFTVNGSS